MPDCKKQLEVAEERIAYLETLLRKQTDTTISDVETRRLERSAVMSMFKRYEDQILLLRAQNKQLAAQLAEKTRALELLS